MDALEVTLFGGFRLRRGSQAVPPMPSRAARSLFAYLAMDRRVQHPRERLAALFWPDLPDNRARRRLSHTLWQVQDAFNELDLPVSYLDVSATAIAFRADVPCTVDVEEFESGLDRARERRSAKRNRVRDLTDLEATVGLYRGEFLAGHNEDWVAHEQHRLHQRYVEALGWLVGLAKMHGAHDDALVYARRLTNEDPLREDGHREVMRLSVLLGRTTDAIRQYERCREVLADELDAAPSSETTQLYERLLRRTRRTAAADTNPVLPSETASVSASPPVSSADRTGGLTTNLPADRGPLVGRDRERDRVVAVLDRALTGRGGAALVEGEAGIGVSRLLEEATDDAHWRDFAIASISCSRPGRAIAYRVIQDLLDEVLSPLRIEHLRQRIAPVWLAEAAVLAPALAPAGHAWVAPDALRSAENADRMREALSQVLCGLAATEPLAMVIDDVHWADIESLAVLESVASHVADNQIALVLGYRGEEARTEPDIWEAMRSIDRVARPERVKLAPLDAFSSGEVIRMLVSGNYLDTQVLNRLHEETGGNPLFLVETVRALADEDLLGALGDRAGEDQATLPLPTSIRALVLQRLERLAAEPRAVLDVAAVADGPLDLETLAGASDLPREVVLVAADQLVRRRLLRQNTTTFAFQHEQVRRAAVETLTETARKSLHGRLAETLETTHPDAVEALAHHYLHADRRGRATRYLIQAGRHAAAIHAYASAERHYRQAVEGRAPTTIAKQFALLTEYETVLDVLGERTRQREVLAELRVLADGDGVRQAEVARREALLLGQLGDLAGAVAAGERALSVADQLDDKHLLGLSLVAYASVLGWAGRRVEAAEVLQRAVAVADGPDRIAGGGGPTAGAADVSAQAQVQLGSVLRELQRYDEATRVLRDVLQARDAVPREEAMALGVLGTIEMETGNSAEAVQLYTQAMERSVTLGFRRGEGVNLVNRAVAHSVLSDLGSALADFEAAAQCFAALRDSRGEAMVRVNLAFVHHSVLGDDVTAGEQARQAMHFFEEIEDQLQVAQCLDTLAAIAQRGGDYAQATAHVEAGMQRLGGDDAGWVRPQLLRRRAEIALAVGQPDAALSAVDDALLGADQAHLRDLLPVLYGMRGEVLLALGEVDEAVTVTAQGRDGLHPGVDRSYLVLAQHALALEASGDHIMAVEVAREAMSQLTEVLASVDEHTRSRALELAEHRRIGAIVDRLAPELVSVTVAAAGAPTGRPLTEDERVEVVVARPVLDRSKDPVASRRNAARSVIDDITRQGGEPTVDDLAAVLQVSIATIRRDLGALRDQGIDIHTRGRRTG